MSNLEEVKTEDFEQKIVEDKKEIADAIKQFENAIENSDEFGIDFLDNIFLMEDKDVAVIGQHLLWEMDKTLDSDEAKMAIAQAMKMDSISPNDLSETYQQIIDEVKDIDELSDVKKDFTVQLFGIIFNKMEEYYDVLDQKIIIPTETIGEATLPKYACEGDGAMDVYALDDYTIHPGETKLIPTGIKMAIPRGYGILVQPRSGLSLKSKLRIANTPGLIDSGYRDEIGVIVENISPSITDIKTDWDEEHQHFIVTSVEYGGDEFITKGERFAQLRLVQVPTAFLQPVNKVDEIGENRGGGFGHTGV